MSMSITAPARRSIGNATALWGVVFAVVHFYWAAGGNAGFDDDQTRSIGASLYIGFVAVLGLVGAGVGYGLRGSGGDRAGRRSMMMLARLGSVALLLGVVVGVGRWIAAGSLGDDGVPGIVITAYFLLGGVLFALLGWPRRRHPMRRSPGPIAPPG